MTDTLLEIAQWVALSGATLWGVRAHLRLKGEVIKNEERISAVKALTKKLYSRHNDRFNLHLQSKMHG